MKPKDELIQLMPNESFRLLQWKDNLQEVIVLAADGTRMSSAGAGHEWHHHPQMELTLIERGAGTLFIGDAITRFHAPDLVLIGHDLPHYWHMRQPSSGFALQFGLSSEHPFWQFPETAALRGLWEDSRRGVRFYGPPVQAVADLIRDAAECGGMARLALFIRVLANLSTLPPQDRPPLASTTFAPPTSQSAYRGLQKAINLIFNRFAEDLTFNEILSEAGMSKATFERHFKRHTGKHFTRFLAEVRMNSACRQLIDTDLPVSEIALASGYGNLSYFHRQFRDLFGCSPLAFRRKITPN
ncbi:MAG: AraC family transcriptional regulator [Kiritimatiellae bacterium]|nr:AraC family transcriptional regulator [Kiritimatiellia bacterium]